MNHIIIEIKARCPNPEQVRTVLKTEKARYVGKDHQIDTYFQVPEGRLKLRQGNIEKTLIFYNRANQAGPKKSEVSLFRPAATDDDLRQVLTSALGVKVIVDKQREIYFIENIKFHIDQVEGLGSFVEIEAIDTNQTFSEAELLAQCQKYIRLFGIEEKQLIECSYSDLLLQKI